MNYYNEFDPKAAAWLRELIAAGEIPDGDVDTRDIRQVQAHELTGYIQCHFFAGIAGWSEALRIAGWPVTRPAWTGSCPCQPFSALGAGKAQADERHLWPEMYRLIRECQPVTVFGEQVNAAVGHGWLDGISADMERESYAIGSIVLGAHSRGAPHIRQRIWWAATRDSESSAIAVGHPTSDGGRFGVTRQSETQPDPLQRESVSGLSIAERSERWPLVQRNEYDRRQTGQESGSQRSSGSATRWMGEPIQPGSQGHARNGDCLDESGRLAASEARSITAASDVPCGVSNPAKPLVRSIASAWNESGDRENRLILCRDGKIRRVPLEPAFFPLVDGFSGVRVGLLRGAGNAIVPEVAAEFIQAFCEVQNDTDF